MLRAFPVRFLDRIPVVAMQVAVHLTCLAALAVPVCAQVKITNLEDGEEVRHRTLLVRGTCDNPGPVVVRVAGDEDTPPYRAEVRGGRFMALVDLDKGTNKLEFTVGDGRPFVFEVRYEPPRDPHRLRLVYVTAKDRKTQSMTLREGDDADRYRAKMSTMAKIAQAFVAEAMHDAGQGRRTFQLERDESGDVVVHVVHSKSSAKDLADRRGYALFSRIDDLILDKFADENDKCLALTAFTTYDPKKKRLSGYDETGRDRLTVMSNAYFYAWPNSLAEVPRAFTDPTPVDETRVPSDGQDTVGEVASASLGQVVRELGRSCRLPSGFDEKGIMSQVGRTRLRHAFVPLGEIDESGKPDIGITAMFALRLWRDPWLQADPPRTTRLPPPATIDFDAKHRRLRLKSRVRWHGWSVQAGDPTPTAGVAVDMTDSSDKTIEVSFDRARADLKVDGRLVVYAYDEYGREVKVDEAAWDALTTWRVRPELVDWDRDDVKIATEEDLEQWRAALRRVRPHKHETTPDARFHSLDLVELFDRPRKCRTVALSTFRADDAVRAKLSIRADDGARVWLNGKLVVNAIDIGIIEEEVEVDVVRGTNEVFVQAFQGPGDWGFTLRLTTGSGEVLGKDR